MEDSRNTDYINKAEYVIYSIFYSMLCFERNTCLFQTIESYNIFENYKAVAEYKLYSNIYRYNFLHNISVFIVYKIEK